ncbi:MAG: N-acetyltransferase [Clostridia bacterium]
MIIRLERPDDHRRVEEMTRDAFWNIHVPGCDEHLLVHKLRKCDAFIPELDFVAVIDDKIVGNIMYSYATVTDSCGQEHEVLTFGPISVDPDFQRQGIGSSLIIHSLSQTRRMCFKAVIIFGHPAYYQRFGFQAAKVYGIITSWGKYMAANMALPLYEGALDGITGIYRDSPVFEPNAEELKEFEKTFPYKEKCVIESQKEFERVSKIFL